MFTGLIQETGEIVSNERVDGQNRGSHPHHHQSGIDSIGIKNR